MKLWRAFRKILIWKTKTIWLGCYFCNDLFWVSLLALSKFCWPYLVCPSVILPPTSYIIFLTQRPLHLQSLSSHKVTEILSISIGLVELSLLSHLVFLLNPEMSTISVFLYMLLLCSWKFFKKNFFNSFKQTGFSVKRTVKIDLSTCVENSHVLLLFLHQR